MKNLEQVSQILSSSKTAIAIMISSGRISKMNIIFSVQKLLFLKKIILIQLALKKFTWSYGL